MRWLKRVHVRPQLLIPHRDVSAQAGIRQGKYASRRSRGHAVALESTLGKSFPTTRPPPNSPLAFNSLFRRELGLSVGTQWFRQRRIVRSTRHCVGHFMMRRTARSESCRRHPAAAGRCCCSNFMQSSFESAACRPELEIPGTSPLQVIMCEQELDARKQEIEHAKKLSSDDIAALQKTIQSQQLENSKLGQGLKSQVCLLFSLAWYERQVRPWTLNPKSIRTKVR